MSEPVSVSQPKKPDQTPAVAALPEALRSDNGAQHLERLAQSFEISARRWELIVYPSLFAFIILAAYGFYLIYSLANDVSFIARSVDKNMVSLASSLEVVTQDMDQLTVAVGRMSNNMQNISGTIEVLDTMTMEMNKMQRSVSSMNEATHFIRGDMATLNHSIGRPMSFVNKFMPW